MTNPMSRCVLVLIPLFGFACSAESGTPDAGCTAPEENATCEATAQSVSVAIASLAAQHDGCADAADCALVAPRLNCAGGGHFQECAVAIASAEATAFQAAVDGLAPSYCGCAPGCVASGTCAAVEAACVDGSCVTQPSTAD